MHYRKIGLVQKAKEWVNFYDFLLHVQSSAAKSPRDFVSFALIYELIENNFVFQLESQLAHADFQRKVHELVSQIDEDGVQDQKLRRQLKYLAVVGHAALPRDQLNRVSFLAN